jgi:hypothetical protein
MLVGAGTARWRLAHAALLAGVLTGCSQASDGESRAGSSAQGTASEASGATGAVAERGGTIGASGSACELPVTFGIAKGWKAEAVDGQAGPEQASGPGSDDATNDPSGDPGDEVADALLHQGPVTAACEIDAKPAGNIGFLRVWTGEPGDDDARTVLKAFVAAEDGASHAEYRAVKAGDLDGVEVSYRYTSEILDETKQERALAVATSHGPVVLHLGGMDTEEHREMLPALELAKRTLQITS